MNKTALLKSMKALDKKSKEMSKREKAKKKLTEKEQAEHQYKELEIIRFKIKEQLWSVLEPNFGTRIACDHFLAKRLNAKVDECFDSIDHIRELNKKGQETTK